MSTDTVIKLYREIPNKTIESKYLNKYLYESPSMSKYSREGPNCR
jgi:hypothetical protein